MSGDLSHEPKFLDTVYEILAKLGWLTILLVGGFVAIATVVHLLNNETASTPAPPRPRTDADLRAEYRPYVQPYATWERGGFGGVLLAQIRIANMGRLAVKDVALRCTLYGKSGTAITSKTLTIYERVAPDKTTERTEHNLGFLNGQEDSMTCETVDFAWAD